MSIDRFIEHVEHVCRRRGMYVPNGSFDEVCAYFTGYAAASPDCPLAGEGWAAFNAFICAAFGFPSKYSWPYVLKQSSGVDETATDRLRELLTDFAERSKTESFSEIVEEAMAQASAQAEGEPERAWRRFSRAVLRGEKEDIAPLIQEHPDAPVLWAGSYPGEVAWLLDEIEDSYQVSQISGSRDEGEVTIITPDFGPVGVKLIDGHWRVDASKVIERWKANRDAAQQRHATDG